MHGLEGVVLAAFSALLMVPTVGATAPGAIKLDNYTFDKVVAIPGYSLLAKFDQSYAYGEKEDEFKTLCTLAHVVPNFLIGEIPVQEYGDKDNEDLRDRFNLKKDDFPAFLLFNDEYFKEGLRYTGPVKADDIAAWLRRNQIKMPSVGTIAEMDEIVKVFFKEGMADSRVDDAKKLAEGSYKLDRKAGMYVKIMEKIKEKGEPYVATETARVSKILTGKLTPEKQAEMGDKLKVLGVFANKDDL